jgi:hypothetical protein
MAFAHPIFDDSKTTSFLRSIHMTYWRPTAILVLVLMSGITVLRAGPADDIVTVTATGPLPADDVPGLLEGGEIIDGLKAVRDELQAGVPEVARGELRSLVSTIDRLDRGGRLPDGYRSGGDLWLPVKAVAVRILLDAPDLLPRPQDKGEGGSVGDLTTGGKRIDWLPLLHTRALLEQASRRLAASQGGGAAAAPIDAALSGVEQTVRFDQPALLGAYYAVQRALGARRPWPQTVRAQLREAARDLKDASGGGDLADQLQTVADQLDPDTGTLLDTARSLRERINSGGREPGTDTPPNPSQGARPDDPLQGE